MRFTKQHGLDLLKETMPYLEFCVGGTNVDETLGKVRLVLQLARRQTKNNHLMEHSNRTCVCSCGHTKTCEACGFYGADSIQAEKL